jgi:hypothetical protein
MNLGTYFETPKHFPMMSGESWKPSCVHMPNSCWRKSGRRWPRGKSSPEAWNAYNQLWLTYYRFRPQNEYERIWYTQSLTRLNQLGDQRRLRLLSSRSGGIPSGMWLVLLGAGAITIAFSYLFGTRNTAAQVLMTASLAMTIALVLLSILALEQPFGGNSGSNSWRIATRMHAHLARDVATFRGIKIPCGETFVTSMIFIAALPQKAAAM